MTSFNISRLHSKQGIFMMSGVMVSHHLFTLTSLSMMGTDGWVPLNINTAHVLNLIDLLQEEIIDHLQQ